MHLYPIHIAFCINDKYVPYTTVVIRSIVENNRNNAVDIHIVTDRISDAEVKLLNESIDGFGNAHIHIYIIDDKRISDLKSGVWTRYTWYRVLLPEVLPSDVSRVLYLDADTVVMTDLSRLFALDMTDKAIAAVADIQSWSPSLFERLGYDMSKEYICSGVMMMNLEYWRSHNTGDAIIEWAAANCERLVCPDQDAINYICRDSKVLLPLKYGILQWFFKYDTFYTEPYRAQLKECITAPAIIHYAGCAPWYRDATLHIMRREWFRYNRMLRHPARRSYHAKGMAVAKVVIWKMLHPFGCCGLLTLKKVRHRLKDE